VVVAAVAEAEALSDEAIIDVDTPDADDDWSGVEET
jgi:hypothetical protein